MPRPWCRGGWCCGWCGRGDSNPHGCPLEPKSSASASSATPAWPVHLWPGHSAARCHTPRRWLTRRAPRPARCRRTATSAFSSRIGTTSDVGGLGVPARRRWPRAPAPAPGVELGRVLLEPHQLLVGALQAGRLGRRALRSGDRAAAPAAAEERTQHVAQQAGGLVGLLRLDLGRRHRRLLVGRGHLGLERRAASSRYLSRSLAASASARSVARLATAGDEGVLVLADAGVELQRLVDEDVGGAVADKRVDDAALQARPERLVLQGSARQDVGGHRRRLGRRSRSS